MTSRPDKPRPGNLEKVEKFVDPREVHRDAIIRHIPPEQLTDEYFDKHGMLPVRAKGTMTFASGTDAFGNDHARAVSIRVYDEQHNVVLEIDATLEDYARASLARFKVPVRFWVTRTPPEEEIDAAV